MYIYSDHTHNSMHSVCVCVCVCVRARASALVFVCMCALTDAFPSDYNFLILLWFALANGVRVRLQVHIK